MLEISAGDFREQRELAGIQGSDAADMLSICLSGYRTMDLGRGKKKKKSLIGAFCPILALHSFASENI